MIEQPSESQTLNTMKTLNLTFNDYEPGNSSKEDKIQNMDQSFMRQSNVVSEAPTSAGLPPSRS